MEFPYTHQAKPPADHNESDFLVIMKTNHLRIRVCVFPVTNNRNKTSSGQGSHCSGQVVDKTKPSRSSLRQKLPNTPTGFVVGIICAPSAGEDWRVVGLQNYKLDVLLDTHYQRVTIIKMKEIRYNQPCSSHVAYQRHLVTAR